MIAGFVKKHPGVEISLSVRNRGQTVEALRGYEIDFAVMGRPPRDFPIEAATFGPHPLVLVAAPSHPLAGRTGLSREDLADQPFFFREEGSGTRTVFEEFMSGILVKRALLDIDTGSNETIKQSVMAGLGIALLSVHSVAAEVESGRLALLDVKGLPIRRDWYAVRRADKVLGPAASAVWSYLMSDGARMLPGVALPDAAGAKA